MKPLWNKLPARVLARLEAGQPRTRWQQLRLHLQTMLRQLQRKRFSTLWFHGQGILRVVWKSFTVCRFFGVPVQFHTTWFVYPAGFLVWLLFDFARPWKMFFVLLMLLVICVSLLVHEFAHVLTARRFGIGARRVVMIPPGAFAELESGLRSPSEFSIALAGPLSSLWLAGVFWLGLQVSGSFHGTWKYHCLYQTMRAGKFGFQLNLWMAGFNLLPCFPLDGGRVLRSALAVGIGRFFPQYSVQALVIATLVTVRYVSWPVAWGVMVYAFFQWEDYWLYLILFPLLLFVAEIEYLLAREGTSESGRDEKQHLV